MPDLPNGPAVYLLHIEPRFHHAGHYLGHASDLCYRLMEQQAGRGSRLVAAAIKAGCKVELVRWWPGTRTLEASFKRHGGKSSRSRNGRHGAARSLAIYCPKCNPTARRNRPEPAGWLAPVQLTIPECVRAA